MRTPSKDQLPMIAALLAESGLPTDDLQEIDLSLFRVKGSGGSLDAVGGLEQYGESALIRSVAISPGMRGRGIAGKLVGELEELANNRGIHSLYLLTETAERFFGSKGYSVVARSDVPPSVQKSRQFSSLCPDTATVMFKRIGVGTKTRK